MGDTDDLPDGATGGRAGGDGANVSATQRFYPGGGGKKNTRQHKQSNKSKPERSSSVAARMEPAKGGATARGARSRSRAPPDRKREGKNGKGKASFTVKLTATSERLRKLDVDQDLVRTALQRYLDVILQDVRETTGVALLDRCQSFRRNTLTAELGSSPNVSVNATLTAVMQIKTYVNDDVTICIVCGDHEKRVEAKDQAIAKMKEFAATQKKLSEDKLRELQADIDDVTASLAKLHESKASARPKNAWKHIQDEAAKTQEIEVCKQNMVQAQRFARELEIVVQNMQLQVAALDVGSDDFDRVYGDLMAKFAFEMAASKNPLPINAYRSEINKSVKENAVTILLAETGSGKSSQVAKFLYNDCPDNRGSIACTQPRRLAASNLAEHVSKSMALNRDGRKRVVADFGYETDGQVGMGRADIVYTTDRALLDEWSRDNSLSNFRCVIVDEAHERSLCTDLLLSILKKTLKARPDFRIVVTSATINPTVFSNYFSGYSVNIVNVPGKLHPVSVSWESKKMSIGNDYLSAAVDKVLRILESDEDDGGNILVFVATQADTEKGPKMLEEKCGAGTFRQFLVLPLHGGLPAEDQQLVFDQSSSHRKIIFSTNVAETSVTVPGVTAIVDCGVAKERQFDSKSGAGILKLVAISKSSATQRKGRAGRTAPGRCYRLYTQDDYEGMREAVEPEIKRLPLDQCLLLLFKLGVKAPLDYEFIDEPDRQAIVDSLQSLQFLEAIVSNSQSSTHVYSLTERGRKMAAFAIDPRLSCMLVQAVETQPDLVRDAMAMCALISNGGSIFFRHGSEEDLRKADKHRMRFCDERGDFWTALNVYNEWRGVREAARSRWCSDNWINAKSMRNAQLLIRELRTICRSVLKVEPPQENPQHQMSQSMERRLARLLATCYLRNVAMFAGHQDHGYVTRQGGQILSLHPSSSISYLTQKDPPMFLVFDNIFTTHKSYLVTVSVVDQDVKQIFSNSIISRKLVKEFELPRRFGPFTLKAHVIGKGATLLRQTESELKAQLGSEKDDYRGPKDVTKFLKIEAHVDKGRLAVFCNEDYAECVVTYLSSKIHGVLEELRTASEMLKLSDNLKLSFLVGAGGVIVSPVFPTDFTEICVKPPFVRKQIQEFAAAQLKCRRKPLFLNDGRCFLNFQTPEEVSNAYELLEKALESLSLEKKQVVKRRKQEGKKEQRQSVLSITLTLRRKQRTNFGFAIFPDSITAALYIAATLMHSDWNPSPSKKGLPEVFLRKMAPTVIEEDIRESARRIPGLGDEVARKVQVKLPCVKQNFSSSQDDIDHLEANIRRQLLPLLSGDRTFEMRIPPCQDHHSVWRIFLNTDDAEIGDKIMNMLKSERPSFSDGKHTYPFAGAECNINSTYFAFEDVYEFLREEVQAQCPELIEEKRLNGRICLRLEGHDVQQVARGRQKLVKLLEGQKLKGEGVKVLCRPGQANRAKLREVEEKRCVIIRRGRDGCGMPILTVFGKDDSVTMALDDLTTLMEDILLRNSMSCEINLKGKGLLLKAIVRKYGAGLAPLKEREDISDVNLIIKGRHRQILLWGSSEGLKQIKDEFELMERELQIGGSNEGAELCSTCFTEPDGDDRTRLELCGHLTCVSCLQLQMEAGSIPLVCPSQDCGELVCVRDIREATQSSEGGGQRLQQKFLRSSLADFVGKSQGRYHPCPTADCGGVFRRDFGTANTGVFFCEECKAEICTRCCIINHVGLSCEAFKMKNGENNDLKKWFESDRENRKLCPICNSGIEKVEGCDHMTCTNCKTHLCWRCLETFPQDNPTGVGVYDHLERCRGH